MIRTHGRLSVAAFVVVVVGGGVFSDMLVAPPRCGEPDLTLAGSPGFVLCESRTLLIAPD
jgi:hypothetical protein